MLIPIEWLKKLNEELRAAGIDHRRRPWEAMRRYSIEFKTSFSLPSPIADEIFSWFKAYEPLGASEIGPLYQSVYYYDAAFWPVSIPHFLGTVRLNALDCLQDMPTAVKSDLTSANRSAWDYIVFWADCVDYAAGVNDLLKRKDVDERGLQFLAAGDQELRSSVSLLKERRPNARAILTSRMATEMFLKAFIAFRAGLTDKEARALNHDLDACFDRFIEVSRYTHWAHVKNRLAVYPAIAARYEEQSHPPTALWEGFALAQSFGTVLAREMTGRNLLSQVLSNDAP